jgi:hypothetical protein
MRMKHTTKNSSNEDSGNTKHSKALDVQQDNSKSNENKTNGIKRKRDEEISACFEAAKQKIGRLLTSKKQTINDLARELERLGRPVDHIAAEIVHELRNCDELSRSQIYSYLDDKYKNQTQAQRRKGKKESNPDPKTGTESPLEQTITVDSNGQQTIYNEPDTQDPVDTPDESDNNQRSNLANLQKSDWNPDPKTGTESLSPEQVTTEQSNTTSNEGSEILKLEYSLPYQYVQQYMAAEYKQGKSKVWFSVEIDVKSKKVASARTGRISEA